MQMSDVRIIV